MNKTLESERAIGVPPGPNPPPPTTTPSPRRFIFFVHFPLLSAFAAPSLYLPLERKLLTFIPPIFAHATPLLY